MIRRVDEKSYEFYSAPSGQALMSAGNLTLTGASGSGEQAPDIPGIYMDPGLGSFAALVDDFVVGREWPITPGAPRPDAPVMKVPRPVPKKHALELVLPDDIYTLPKLKSTRHIVYMPRDDGDFTYHHNA